MLQWLKWARKTYPPGGDTCSRCTRRWHLQSSSCHPFLTLIRVYPAVSPLPSPRTQTGTGRPSAYLLTKLFSLSRSVRNRRIAASSPAGTVSGCDEVGPVSKTTHSLGNGRLNHLARVSWDGYLPIYSVTAVAHPVTCSMSASSSVQRVLMSSVHVARAD